MHEAGLDEQAAQLQLAAAWEAARRWRLLCRGVVAAAAAGAAAWRAQPGDMRGGQQLQHTAWRVLGKQQQQLCVSRQMQAGTAGVSGRGVHLQQTSQGTALCCQLHELLCHCLGNCWSMLSHSSLRGQADTGSQQASNVLQQRQQLRGEAALSQQQQQQQQCSVHVV